MNRGILPVAGQKAQATSMQRGPLPILLLSVSLLAAGAFPPRTTTAVSPALVQSAARDGTNWPSFRGPGATGVTASARLPTHWDSTTGENVRWAVPIPGYSHSSPIVWGDRVFVTTAISNDPALDGRRPGAGNVGIDDLARREWKLYAFDRASGGGLWQATAHSGVPRVRRHEKGSHANSTPATNGTHVVAVFNSEGIFCWSVDGELLWTKNLGRLDPGYWGRPDRPWGHASSPILFEDLVIVQADDFEDSFLAAFRLADGEEAWRVERDELAVWATPTLFESGGRTSLVAQGGNFIRGYDPRTGNELWRLADHAEVKVPTPFVADGMIIATGGAPAGRPIYALDLAAIAGEPPAGADARSATSWTIGSGGPYTSTPLAYDSVLYVTRDTGILGAYDLQTGERLYRQRLGSGFSASPVAADNKVYLCSEDGQVFVVEPGGEFALLATNEMNESCFATPAISGDMLFIRTRTRLYALAESPGTAETAAGEPLGDRPNAGATAPQPPTGRESE